ncbi:MAG: SusD/RagB family nutrient-binding outer membrane lipoprotein [Chitinophaga sp.]|uniref:SusD/RagB family nutrient-binding outer membrane lipoprotein n=1 Tax=Chitinophaga sp. TaxID=1869181 RepID=UPI001B0C9B29|nr:SusD/RagB family nutrient-binding outer membrane lipoprotein [Chitinophaga sp.]MBO9730714.1 SusD/RagB family nutrient-binding outer membrane lipoprotein [Chitinophaga sp.]
MKKNIITLAFLSALLLSAPGCKKFLDVNKDPNHAVDVTVDVLLPSAQSGLTFALGNTLTIDGGIWGQYWTQSPTSSQYKNLDQYSPSEGDFGNVWFNIQVDALENLQKVIDKGNATNKKQYVAIGMLLKAYAAQLSTDLWGDVPFTQATQGDATTPILYPKFDTQSDIYTGIVKLIDDATKLIDPDDPNAPGGDDLIYGGDMTKWLHFANTLKLRVGLRLAKKDATRAGNIVKTLQGADFIQPGESALQNFNSTGGQTNPLYGAMAGSVLGRITNLVASSTAVNFFSGNSDPRLNAFYNKVGSAVVGIPQGSFNNPPTTTVSLPSAATGANPTDANSAFAPVKLMTDYEADFLQAEAIARGWLTGATAADMYNQGITDNFTAYGVDGAADYMAQPAIAYPAGGDVETQVKAIITQKWAAMCGNQTIEAWTEWRRTGYPSFFVISKASIIGANRWPGIFLYPSSELTRNPNAPKTNHLVYDKVWWAN